MRRLKMLLVLFLALSLPGLSGCKPGQASPSPSATTTSGESPATLTPSGQAATPAAPATTAPTSKSGAPSPTVSTPTVLPPTSALPLAVTLTPWPTHTLPAGAAPTASAAGTATAAAKATAAACPGAPPIRLAVGMKAMVSLNPPVPSRVRAQPGLQANPLGQIDPGETVTVLDGPRCADHYNWWKVQSTKGLTGWTVEGDQTDYWLVPAP